MNHVHKCVTGKLYAKLFSEKKTEKETRKQIRTCDLHEYQGTALCTRYISIPNFQTFSV